MEQIDIDRYNKGQNKKLRNAIGCGNYIVINGNIRNVFGFLLDPKYGWREMFDNDADYQKEFWEWMDEKDYGSNPGHRLGNHYSGYYTPQSQMLTGFILEFMQERVTNQQTKE